MPAFAGMTVSGWTQAGLPKATQLASDYNRAACLELNHVAAGDVGFVFAVEGRHRLVRHLDLGDRAEAVEAGPHRAAIGAEHSDLDIVARAHVRRKMERPGHMVEIVAGRPVEAEAHVANVRFLLAKQLHREAPADMRRIEQSAI